MANAYEEILAQVRQLAQQLPLDAALRLAEVIEQNAGGSLASLTLKAQLALPNPAQRNQFRGLLDSWQRLANLSHQAVALALEEAAYSAAEARHAQQLELVWTGPTSEGAALRRNDEALIQLINEAGQRLTIVTFAVYKVEAIAEALVHAAQRGVKLRIILESTQASERKLTYDTLAALGKDVISHAQLFLWPKEQRPKDDKGHYGSLHAKCAIADGATLLISSANLTDYAMQLNMEMGLLVRGGALPAQVEQHFDLLIKNHVLMPV